MIDFLRGKLTAVHPEAVVVEVGGVGLRVNVAPSLISGLPQPGEMVHLYTYLVVRENALELFGFGGELDRTAFLHLLGVAGIGPRTALAVVGQLGARRLWAAILQEDTKLLATVPGIGAKSARRIVVELKERLEKLQLVVDGETPPAGVPIEGEAFAALVSLGYTPKEAAEALRRVPDPEADTTELIRSALRTLGGVP